MDFPQVVHPAVAAALNAAHVQHPASNVVAAKAVAAKVVAAKEVAAHTSCFTSSAVQEGSRVRIESLQSKPELNGRMGVCGAFNQENGRWTVRIDANERGPALQVLIRTANLKMIRSVLEDLDAFDANARRNVVKFERRCATAAVAPLYSFPLGCTLPLALQLANCCPFLLFLFPLRLMRSQSNTRAIVFSDSDTAVKLSSCALMPVAVAVPVGTRCRFKVQLIQAPPGLGATSFGLATSSVGLDGISTIGNQRNT